MARKSDLESKFLNVWLEHAAECPTPVREYTFAPPRRWRFDFAWPEQKVAVECEGGGGRHHTYKGMHDDCEKYNTATANGWKVIRVTNRQLIDDPHKVIEWVLDCAETQPKERNDD